MACWVQGIMGERAGTGAPCRTTAAEVWRRTTAAALRRVSSPSTRARDENFGSVRLQAMPRAIVDPRGSGAQDGRIAGPSGVRHGRLRKTEWRPFRPLRLVRVPFRGGAIHSTLPELHRQRILLYTVYPCIRVSGLPSTIHSLN